MTLLLHELSDHIQLDVAYFFLHVVFHHCYVLVKFAVDLFTYMGWEVDFDASWDVYCVGFVGHFLVEYLRRSAVGALHLDFDLVDFHWLLSVFVCWFVYHLHGGSLQFTQFLLEVILNCGHWSWRSFLLRFAQSRARWLAGNVVVKLICRNSWLTNLWLLDSGQT